MVALRTLVGWAAKPGYAASFTAGSLVDYTSAVTLLASASPTPGSSSARSDSLQLRELVSNSLKTIGKSVNPLLQRRAMPEQIAALLKSHERLPWISDEGIHLLGLRATIYRFVAPLDSLTSMVTHFAVLGYYNLALVEEWVNRVQKEANNFLTVEHLLAVVNCVKRLHRFTSGLSDSQVNQILASLPFFQILTERNRLIDAEGDSASVVTRSSFNSNWSNLSKELIEIGTSYSRVLADWLERCIPTSGRLVGAIPRVTSPTPVEILDIGFATTVIGNIQVTPIDCEILKQVVEKAEMLPSSEEYRGVARLIGVSMAVVVGRHFCSLSDTHWELLLRINDALARPGLFSIDLQKSRRLIVLGFCKYLSLDRGRAKNVTDSR